MKINKKFLAPALAAFLVAGSPIGEAVAAKTLRYAIGYPPGSDTHVAAENYAKHIEAYSDGEIKVRVFPLSLLNFAETSAGVRDGLADIGFLLSPYFPAEFPHTNIIAEATMQTQVFGDAVRGKEGPAFVGAMNEYIFLNCPECHDEFAKQNHVFTGVVSSSPFNLACNAPVTEVADLKGKRLRAGGSQWLRWALEFGAVPVTLSANDAFEALSQGVVDCVTISVTDMANLGIIDATKDITVGIPGGVFGGAPAANFNLRTWRSLTDKQRQAALRASAHLSAENPWVYHQREIEVLELAKKRGINVHEASPELINATLEFVKKDMQVIAQSYQKNYKVQRSDQMLTEFQLLLAKWVDLVKNVNSKEELADIYWNEVFSKVDPVNHGM